MDSRLLGQNLPIQFMIASRERVFCSSWRADGRFVIPVIDLESLLAMKLHALKDRLVRKDRDLLDIR